MSIDPDIPVFYISEDRQDPTWTGLGPDAAHTAKIDFVNLSQIEQWIVKLSFKQEKKLRFGSGAYVNFPSSLDGIAYDVILTAGHNLIDKDGVRSADMTILVSDDPKQNIPIPAESIRIAKAYEDDRECLEADWGVILMERKNWKVRKGFGYTLKLEDVEFIPGAIHVHGYRDKTTPGKPVMNTGECVASIKQSRPGGEQLRYKVTTEQGMSGSPVWAEYNGREMIVAVQ